MIPQLAELETLAQEAVDWLVLLHTEIGQPAKRDINTQVKAPKIIGSPAPWNSEVAGLMMVIEESGRRHVRHLRGLLGHVKPVTSSTEGSRTAILALPTLIDAARTPYEDAAGLAHRELAGWPKQMRSVLDFARADEIRDMQFDTRCPYCREKLWGRADGSTDVVCRSWWCHHHDGVPCKDLKNCDVTFDRQRYQWARADWARLLDDLAKHA